MEPVAMYEYFGAVGDSTLRDTSQAMFVGLKSQPLFSNKSIAPQRIPKLFTIHHSLFTHSSFPVRITSIPNRSLTCWILSLIARDF